MADLTVPHETSEFMAIPLTDDDGVAITDFQVAVTRWPARPTAWQAPTIQGDDRGVVLAGLEHGTHVVWANVSGTVISVGSVWAE